MKTGRCLIATTVLLTALIATGSVRAQDESYLASFAANWIEVHHEEAQVPGVIAALVVDGEIVMTRGWGVADVAAALPADANTRFRVGSVSKPVTATLALLAMQEYGIAPDEDLQRFLSDLPIEPPLEGPLTFHELLAQAGGFSESLSGQHVTDASAFLDLQDYLDRRLPPRFEEPGRVITYNDHHTVLAGYAVERASGEPFADYARARLFAPLGMDHTTFDQFEIVEGATAPLAQSYNARGEAYPRDYIMTVPAAGLATTAADMGRYLSFLLDPGEGFLAPDLHDRQTSVQFRNDPRLRGRAYGFAETTRGGHLVLYKDGQANGFGARIVIVPDLGLGIFVAVNRSVLGPMGRRNAAGDLLRGFTGAVLEEAVPGLTDFEAPRMLEGVDSREYEGVYRTTVAARHTWEKLLAMMDTARVEAMDDGSLRIGSGLYLPVDEGVYAWHEGGGFHIAFERFEEDGPTYLIFGSGSYERVPWYGDQDGTLKLVTVIAGVGLLMLIASLVALVRHRLKPWRALAALGGVARIGFFATLAGTLALMDPQGLFYGMPLGVSIAVALGLVSLGADGLSLLAFLRAKKNLAVTALALVYFASTAVFLWWLNYWNLLGWQV